MTRPLTGFEVTAAAEYPCDICGREAVQYVYQDEDHSAAGHHVCQQHCNSYPESGLSRSHASKTSAQGDHRIGIVRSKNVTLEQVQNYLPSNFKASQRPGEPIYIEGYDNAGWTMEDYVIPRLSSGMIGVEDLTDKIAADPTQSYASLSTCGSCNLSIPGDDALCWHCGSPQIHQGSLTFTSSRITVTSVWYDKDSRPTFYELSQLPTLATGMTDDLKWENGDNVRIWVARTTAEDGEPYDNRVTIETYDGNRWSDYISYDGGDPDGNTPFEASYKPRSRFVPNVTNAVLAGLVSASDDGSQPAVDHAFVPNKDWTGHGADGTCLRCGRMESRHSAKTAASYPCNSCGKSVNDPKSGPKISDPSAVKCDDCIKRQHGYYPYNKSAASDHFYQCAKCGDWFGKDDAVSYSEHQKEHSTKSAAGGHLPEPGTISIQPDTRTFSSKTASKTVYVFVHNMPGYMPEAEPESYDSWGEAREAVIDYLDREADNYASMNALDEDDTDDVRAASGLMNECEEAMKNLRSSPGPEWGTIIGNVAYEITQQQLTDEEYAQEMGDRFGSLQTAPTASRVSGMTTTTARYLTATEDDPEPPWTSHEPRGYADTAAYREHYDWVRRQRQKEIDKCRHCKSKRTRTGKPDAVCGPHRDKQRLDYYTHPASETYWSS